MDKQISIYYFFISERAKSYSLFCILISCSGGRNFKISHNGPKVIFYDDKSRSKSKFKN